MGDLRVRRDGAFYGVIRARGVEWCEPGHPDAGPDGWIRSEAPDGMPGELELRFSREKVHERAIAQLEVWRADPASCARAAASSATCLPRWR